MLTKIVFLEQVTLRLAFPGSLAYYFAFLFASSAKMLHLKLHNVMFLAPPKSPSSTLVTYFASNTSNNIHVIGLYIS